MKITIKGPSYDWFKVIVSLSANPIVIDVDEKAEMIRIDGHQLDVTINGKKKGDGCFRR